MLKEVTCLCDWVARGTDDEVVEQLTRHAWEDHGVRKSREGVTSPAPSPRARCLLSSIRSRSSSSAPALTNVAVVERACLAVSLEALFVYLAEDGAHRLRPIRAATLRLGLAPDQQPGDIVALSAKRYGLAHLVHST